MNLGDKISKIKNDLDEKNTARQRREAELTRLQLEKEKIRVEAVFQDAWNEMIIAVDNEKMPEGVTVDDYSHPFRRNKTPKNPQHPYHDIYLTWAEVAKRNGLVLHIVNNHDGCGMRDWEVVTFTIEGK